MTLFSVQLEIDGQCHMIHYESIIGCLSDSNLKKLFDNHVTNCTIYCNDVRMSGLPVIEWERFTDTLISQAQSILRRAQINV